MLVVALQWARDRDSGYPYTVSMTRAVLTMTNMRPRVAVIATTFRGREYGRRAFRLLGCNTLIFMNVHEFLQIGDRSHELSLVYLEHVSPDQHQEGNAETGDRGDQVRAAVGDHLPMVHSIPVQSGGVVPGFRNNDILVSGSLSFAQLCQTLRDFLIAQQLPVVDAVLEWGGGAYRFFVDSGEVYVNGKQLALKSDQFDLALELFFNKDTMVSKDRLKNMIPSHQALRRRSKALDPDMALAQIRDLLGLLPEHGWELRVSPGSRYMLVELKKAELDCAEKQ